MRNTKRTLGTGAAVAVALAVAGLPMTAAGLPPAAEVDSGSDSSSGPWVRGEQWTPPPFQFHNRWLNPDSSPGRWGGYRGYADRPPTVEPPVYDGRDPMPEPTETQIPDPTLPSSTATVAPEPSASLPKPPVYPPADGEPTDQPTAGSNPTDDETAPVPTDPVSGEPVPVDPGGSIPSTDGSAPVPSPSLPGTTKNRSGLPWPSGVYARGQGPRGVGAFAAWRGRPNDVVVDWPARKTWADIINPDWLYQTWKDTPETKVFGVAPVPEGDASATMAGCAAGRYNDKWRQYGVNIKAAGLDDETIVRLGWEFNGNWYKWQASNPAQFAQCWRQIVTSAEQTAPALRWDWNVNRGKGQSVADARLAYPGDAYVDIVGIDSYDAWPGARDEAGWQAQYGGQYGLKFWADFAAAHGKQVSVGEWGNYPGPATAGQSGGDNPFYIAKMVGFFRSQGSNLAYEAYFNESASYFAGAIFAPSQVPAAAAQYRRSLTP